MIDNEMLHKVARDTAARLFYKRDVVAGVIELVQACDRSCPELYVSKRPMWRVLRDEYQWMV